MKSDDDLCPWRSWSPERLNRCSGRQEQPQQIASHANAIPQAIVRRALVARIG
jgi:hypothetical protein